MIGGYNVDDRVIIKVKVSGLTKNHEGVITHIDGSYINVLPDGREEGQVVELYPCEIEMIKDIVQLLNPKIDRYVKIDRAIGEILSHKKTKGPYKNIPIITKED